VSEKELIALLLLTGIGVAATAACLVFPRLRDFAFFGVITGAAFSERMDVNFFSQAWYRGTTRGIEVSLVDLLAFAVLVSSIVLRRTDGLRRIYWPRTLGLFLVYLGYCTFSVYESDPQIFGIFELSKIIRGILIFLCGAFYLRSPRELVLLAFALGCVVCIETTYALRHRVILRLDRVAGTLPHPNSLSMYMVLIGPILVAAATSVKDFRLRYFFGITAACSTLTAVMTVSRTGIAVALLTMVLAMAYCCSWKFSFKKLFAIGGAALIGVTLFAIMWPKIKARYEENDFAGEYVEIQGENRGIYLRWAFMIAEDRPRGVGLNNWSYWVSKDYGHRIGEFKYNEYILGQTEDDERSDRGTYAPPAHNLLALTLGELGKPGLYIFGLLWLRWMAYGIPFIWRRSDPLARWGVGLMLGIFALFLHNLTEWTYRETTIHFTAHIVIGGLIGLRWYRKHRNKTPPTAHPAVDDDGIVEAEFVETRTPAGSRA
jgi:hypothetical protein